MQKLLSPYKRILANFIGKSNFYKFLLTFLLIFIPLFPKFPALRIMGIYVSVRLEDFLILFTFLAFLIPIFTNFKSLIKLKITRSILIFLFIGLVSTISAIYLTQTVSSKIVLLHLFRRVEYLSLFFIGFAYVKYVNTDKKIFEYIIKVLLL